MSTRTDLRRVINAQVRVDRAQSDLRKAVRAAVDAGVTQLEISDALNVNRVTVWRWLKADEENKR